MNLPEIATASIVWPVKKHEYQDRQADSTIWNQFQFRDDDIIIATSPKSGTTWMQQIISQLVFNGKEQPEISKVSPWLDCRMYILGGLYESQEKLLEAMENQTHRRFIKTHLPLDALVFSPKAKYIFVGRDGRDVVWSLFNHHSSFTDEMYNLINNSPGLNGPPLQRPPPSEKEYFRNWLDKDGEPFGPFFSYTRSWLNARYLPNVLVTHYSQLKNNLPNEIERIARFLNIAMDRSSPQWNNILERCSFDYMKRNANKFMPDFAFVGGASTFFKKGTNNRWKDILTEEDCRRYEEKAKLELGEDGAKWLATGE
jgi:aryl sulfotransferase